MTDLRAKRRAATSQAIVDATMALVRGRRLADVSIDEICTTAGIGRRTFFRYFPTKEDVVLDRRRVDRQYVIEELRHRPETESDVDAVMRTLVELQRRTFSALRPEHQLDVHRLTHGEPALAAQSWLLIELIRDAIVEGLNPRGDRRAVLRARILASACVMVVDAGVTTWIEGGMAEDLGAILEEGAAHVRRGFAGQTKRPEEPPIT